MSLQLESPPHDLHGPSRPGNADDRSGDLELSGFESRRIEILQILNHLFDELSEPAALCLSD